MKKKDGGPAFPCIDELDRDARNGFTVSGSQGATLRDYFVAHSRLSLADAKNEWFELNGRKWDERGQIKPTLGDLFDLLARMRGQEADALLEERAA